MGLFSRNEPYGKPVEQPRHTGTVFAVLGCAPDRNAVGAVYFASDGPLGINPYPLMALDYDLAQLDELPQFLAQIGERIQALTQECGTLRPTHAVYVETGGMGQSLGQAAAEFDGLRVEEIPEQLCELDIQELGATATTYAARGKVKFTKNAHEKRVNFDGDTKNHLMKQTLGFNVRAPDVGATELFRAWCLGVLLALEDPPRKAKRA